MAARLTIAPEAQHDIGEAYTWYESQRIGLGEDYLSAVDAAISAICRMPELSSVVHENYRRAFVRRFPYAIFFEHVHDEITIYCVLHTSRDPKKWRQRLP